jgi:hypothetical protein
MHRTHTLALAVVASLSFVACKPKIDNGKVEDSIKSGLKEKGVELDSVSCPKDLPAKKGNDFACTGKSKEGDEFEVNVEQTDDNGTISWKLKEGILDTAKLGDSIEKKIGEKADVKCPSKLISPKPGTKFDCDVTVEGDKKKVEITIEDKEGNLKWKILE